MIPMHIKKQLINFNILASKYAQYKSIKNWNCADERGDKIPWYTYPAIEYLNNLDFSTKYVFEFGSGSSSIYWADKAKDVVSIEYNKVWYKKVKLNLKSNN